MPDARILDHDDLVALPSLLEQGLDEVILPSFSADEINDRDEVLEVTRAGLLRVAARVVDDVVEAMALVEDRGPGEASLLAYLAARPGRRGGGHGGALLDHLRRGWAATEVPLLLAEVHDPRVWPEAEDERPQARLDFYVRHDAEVLDLPWVQPALHEGGAAVPGMLLLVLHRSLPSPVPRAIVERWIDDYAPVGSPGADDVAGVRSALGSRDAVDVLAVADLDRITPLTAP